jgi:hypothetical protein
MKTTKIMKYTDTEQVCKILATAPIGITAS